MTPSHYKADVDWACHANFAGRQCSRMGGLQPECQKGAISCPTELVRQASKESRSQANKQAGMQAKVPVPWAKHMMGDWNGGHGGPLGFKLSHRI
jgi:hypothetical protein